MSPKGVFYENAASMSLFAFLPVFLRPLASLSYVYISDPFMPPPLFHVFIQYILGGLTESQHLLLGVGNAQVNKRKPVLDPALTKCSLMQATDN